MPAEPSDESLVLAWQQGDARAGTRLLRRYVKALDRYYYTKVGADLAEDLRQEALSRVAAAAANFSHRSSFRTYVYRIAHYTLCDLLRYRSSGRGRRDSTNCSLEEFAGPLEFGPTLDNDLRDLICALRTLSVEDQNLFELRHVHGFSYAEISAMTGTTEPAGTLRARVHMINKQLRARLGHVDERLRGPSVFEPATALGDLLRRLAHMLEAMTIGPTTPGLSWPSPACRRYPRVARQHPTLRTCDRLRSSHE